MTLISESPPTAASSRFPAQTQSGGIGSVLLIGLIRQYHARVNMLPGLPGRENYQKKRKRKTPTTCSYLILIISSCHSGASLASGLRRLQDRSASVSVAISCFHIPNFDMTAAKFLSSTFSSLFCSVPDKMAG